MDTKSDLHVCDFCSECFSTQNELQEHYVALHIVQTASVPTDDVTASMTSPPVRTPSLSVKVDSELASVRYSAPVAVATESSDTASREHTEPSVGLECDDTASREHTEPSVRLECDQCLKTFKNKGAFARHRNSAAYSQHRCKPVRQLKRRQCAVCQKMVNSLEKHMILHINSPCGTRKVPPSRDNSEETNAVSGRVKSGFPGAAAVVKQECGEVFRSDYMSTHMLSHSTGKLFHCETCGARFIYETNLRRHLQHSNPDGVSSDICKKSFLCKDYLKAHMNTHLSGGHFECELCQKVYTKKDSLRSHLRRHKIQSVSGAAAAAMKQECTVCGKVFREECMSTNMMRHSAEKRFHCETCGARFKHQANLRSHVQKHSNPYRFSCEICEKKFSRKSHLQVHMNTHSAGGHFECDLCQKVFSNKVALRTHVRRLHTKCEAVGQCSICKKGFPTAFKLARHERRHSERHVCRLCGKLIAKDDMSRHLATHTAEQSFKCPHCDKTYTRKNNLTEHIKQKHSEAKKAHECHVCGAGFMRRYTRDNHMLSKHSDDDTVKNSGLRRKPITLKFACNFCDKRFEANCWLQNHLLTHSGEKPHVCELCHKSFALKSNLLQHQKTHTDSRPVPVPAL